MELDGKLIKDIIVELKHELVLTEAYIVYIKLNCKSEYGVHSTINSIANNYRYLLQILNTQDVEEVINGASIHIKQKIKDGIDQIHAESDFLMGKLHALNNTNNSNLMYLQEYKKHKNRENNINKLI